MAAHAVTRRRRRRAGGFTLVEVMIAVLLTALAISGLLGLYMVESRASGFTRHSTEATVLAQDQLEKLRTQTAGTVSVTETDLDAQGISGSGIYTRISTVSLHASGEFYDVVVRVEWDESGEDKAVQIVGRRNL